MPPYLHGKTAGHARQRENRLQKLITSSIVDQITYLHLLRLYKPLCDTQLCVVCDNTSSSNKLTSTTENMCYSDCGTLIIDQQVLQQLAQ
jgi:hypothetical protein